ncbi:hypothetical protein, partial [Massilicoli timonensis]
YNGGGMAMHQLLSLCEKEQIMATLAHIYKREHAQETDEERIAESGAAYLNQELCARIDAILLCMPKKDAALIKSLYLRPQYEKAAPIYNEIEKSEALTRFLDCLTM